jgi:hypothetical protein
VYLEQAYLGRLVGLERPVMRKRLQAGWADRADGLGRLLCWALMISSNADVSGNG